MTAPKSRGTKSKRDKKRLHIILKKPSLVKCQKCEKLIQSHIVCPFCGYYKGRKVLDVLKKKDKKEVQKKEVQKKEAEKKEVEAKEKKEKKSSSLKTISKK